MESQRMTRSLRLGFFSYLDGDATPSEIYRNVTELFLRADDLGLDAGWVAQHHFGDHGGLPSPFVFFGSIAGQTKQIGLGTAVVTLALENTLRTAEDAAVLETLHPGRLQFGAGTGFATDVVLEAFGKGGQDKRALYDEAIVRLREIYADQPVTSKGDTIYPPAPALRDRLWEAPGSPPRVIEAAKRGSGLLLSRIAIGVTDRSTDDVQRELVDAYVSNLPEGVAPRIALSRTVYATSDPDTAHAQLLNGLRKGVQPRNGQPSPFENASDEELFDLYSVHWGEPASVAASLEAEPLIDEVTDIICQLSPASPTQAQALEAIELLATEVGPALGWTPANAAVAGSR
jgi:alkanesulfonate monooxygenase SsuD/methylene tetrahydromethanopterin reductase-like flavin-dependent oxidoreductase (luciferase family)